MNEDIYLKQLIQCYESSPFPSFKVTNYFPIYAKLFAHLVGTDCVFVETGVLNGGSLFMWRDWLGPKANIIGLDLNPEAKKWEEHGFDIYICDQGDAEEMDSVFSNIGKFDALLDDGGHQSFQQINTLRAGLKFGNSNSIIAIEDTMTSFMKEFSRHGHHSFCEYAKDVTDLLTAKAGNLWPNQMPPIDNIKLMEDFKNVHSVEFFSNIVAFKLSSHAAEDPKLVWNKLPEVNASDFRYSGKNSCSVEWPNPFEVSTVVIRGGGA